MAGINVLQLMSNQFHEVRMREQINQGLLAQMRAGELPVGLYYQKVAQINIQQNHAPLETIKETKAALALIANSLKELI
jgi:hypothetical protein